MLVCKLHQECTVLTNAIMMRIANTSDMQNASPVVSA